jgi:hypothetical protein
LANRLLQRQIGSLAGLPLPLVEMQKIFERQAR